MAHTISRDGLDFSCGKCHLNHRMSFILTVVTFFGCRLLWNQASFQEILKVSLVFAKHKFSSRDLAHLLKHKYLGRETYYGALHLTLFHILERLKYITRVTICYARKHHQYFFVSI
jgi:hypothetical protein